MYDKILAALKAQYSNLGFSDAVLSAIAKQMEGNVTDENGVDAAVKAAEPMLKAFQSDADKRVNTAVDKAKKEKPAEGQDANGGAAKKDEPSNANEEAPQWAKTLIADNKELKDKIGRMEQEKSTGTRQSQIEVALNGVNSKFKDSAIKDFKRMSFEKDEDFNEYLDDLKERAKDFTESGSGEGANRHHRPAAAASGGNSKAVTDKVAESVVNQMM